MDIEKIEQLVAIVQKTEIAELEVKTETGTVRIVNTFPNTILPTPQESTTTLHAATFRAQSIAPIPAATPAPAPSPEEITGHLVKAPMVGTVYLSSKPGASPLAPIGKKVKKGEALCLIEAMKMFNKIEADRSGTIRSCLVENEQPVEYDQTLFVIDEE